MKNIKLIIIFFLLVSGLITSPVHALSNNEITDALNAVKDLNPYSSNIKATDFVDKGTYSEVTLTIDTLKITFVAYKPSGATIANIAYIIDRINFSTLLPDVMKKSFIYQQMPKVALQNVTTILVNPKLSLTKQGETKVDSLPLPIKNSIQKAYAGVEVINLPTGIFSVYQLQKDNSSSALTKILNKIPLGLNAKVTSFISIDAGNYAALPGVNISMSVVLKQDNPINKAVNATQILQSHPSSRPVLTMSGSTSDGTLGIKYAAPYTAFGKSAVLDGELSFEAGFLSGSPSVKGELTVGVKGTHSNPVIVPAIDNVGGIKLQDVKLTDIVVSIGLEWDTVFTVTPGFQAKSMVVKDNNTYRNVKVKLAMINGAAPSGAVINFSSKTGETVDLFALVDLAEVARNANPGPLSLLPNKYKNNFSELLEPFRKLPKTGIKSAHFELVTPGMDDTNHLSDFSKIAGAGVAAKGDLIVFDKKIATADLGLDIVNGLWIKGKVKMAPLKFEGQKIKLDNAQVDVAANWTSVPHFKMHGKIVYDGTFANNLTLSETKINISKVGMGLIVETCLSPVKLNIKTDKNFIPTDKSSITLSSCFEEVGKKIVETADDLSTAGMQSLGINFDSDQTYSVRIDCYDANKSSKDNDNFKTKDKIRATAWQNSLVVEHGSWTVPDCGSIPDEHLKFDTRSRVTHISIDTDGHDAFWMDYVEVSKGGDEIEKFGAQGGGGYCLSTDSNDGKSFNTHGGGCHQTIMFPMNGDSAYVSAKGKAPDLQRIDVLAAFNAGNGQAYFFSREDTYSRFDIKSGQLNGNYPKPVNHKTWKGASFTGLKTVIVAAVNWGNGKAYLFDNLGNYHRWDIESKKVDSGYPKSSQKYWDFREVNAAVNFGNGKAYLFSGTKVTRRDVATRKTDLGYPRKISADFPRLPFKTIDAAYNPGGGKVYFFSDKQYARYDLKSNKIDPGFPKITSSHWIGLE
jgi:hypothetical protein